MKLLPNPKTNCIPIPGGFINRFDLFDAMLRRMPMRVGGVVGLINGVCVEDGSGHNFIVHLCVDCTTHKVYVRG